MPYFHVRAAQEDERKEKGILERQGGFGCTQADGEPHDERNARREQQFWKGGGRQCLM